MTDPAPAPDLSALQDIYEIHGELRDSETARRYVGRRRDDGADVVITIVTPPKGAENNELSHFAADVSLLSNLSYPGIARVYETRWLAPNTLAVASERVSGSTLEEAIERGEAFSNPRIAAVLREVNASLDWARTHGVVHRGVTPDTLYFEPRTGRPVVALAPTPIPITGVPDEHGDARTIARLAWTMLAGRLYGQPVNGEDGEPREPTLAELAPNLADRVVEATDALVHSNDRDETPDIPTFLGIIAAGDVLKQAEVEMAALKEEYHEQHREEIAKCELQRREVEEREAERAAALVEERVAIEQLTAEQTALLAEARADFERIMVERQGQLKAVRDQLTQQAAELERRLSVFDERRRDFEAFRDEQVRQLAEARATDTEYEAEEFIVAPDEMDERSRGEIGGILSSLDDPGAVASTRAADGAARWKGPAIIGGALLVLAALVAGARYENTRVSAPNAVELGSTTVVPRTSADTGQELPRAGFLSQRSASGTLEPQASGAPLARPADTLRDSSAVPPESDTMFATEPEPPRPRPVVRPETRAQQPARREPANDVNGMVPSSIFSLPSRDSLRRRDSLRPRRDIPVRRDTVYRRDTVFLRDTIRPRPDTLRIRPNWD